MKFTLSLLLAAALAEQAIALPTANHKPVLPRDGPTAATGASLDVQASRTQPPAPVNIMNAPKPPSVKREALPNPGEIIDGAEVAGGLLLAHHGYEKGPGHGKFEEAVGLGLAGKGGYDLYGDHEAKKTKEDTTAATKRSAESESEDDKSADEITAAVGAAVAVQQLDKAKAKAKEADKKNKDHDNGKKHDKHDDDDDEYDTLTKRVVGAHGGGHTSTGHTETHSTHNTNTGGSGRRRPSVSTVLENTQSGLDVAGSAKSAFQGNGGQSTSPSRRSAELSRRDPEALASPIKASTAILAAGATAAVAGAGMWAWNKFKKNKGPGGDASPTGDGSSKPGLMDKVKGFFSKGKTGTDQSGANGQPGTPADPNAVGGDKKDVSGALPADYWSAAVRHNAITFADSGSSPQGEAQRWANAAHGRRHEVGTRDQARRANRYEHKGDGGRLHIEQESRRADQYLQASETLTRREPNPSPGWFSMAFKTLKTAATDIKNAVKNGKHKAAEAAKDHAKDQAKNQVQSQPQPQQQPATPPPPPPPPHKMW
ncbi:hypothetical protein ANO11243_090350 [Dothideomycetidae sp. 11243]|nr:hypothetical protein ANO11243_090350 [fungal sp. No.11243]